MGGASSGSKSGGGRNGARKKADPAGGETNKKGERETGKETPPLTAKLHQSPSQPVLHHPTGQIRVCVCVYT